MNKSGQEGAVFRTGDLRTRKEDLDMAGGNK